MFLIGSDMLLTVEPIVNELHDYFNVLLLFRFRTEFIDWIRYRTILVLIGSNIKKLQTKIDLCPTLIWKAFVFENGF